MIFEKQILNMYKGMMYTRCDDTETVFYYSPDDFDGLQKEPYAFTASAGHKLQGYIYHYDHPVSDRIIVFDHGFGGGHRAYMKEIEMLCKHGYTVFAYDHTGCMESGGISPNGMAQSLCDLNDCIKTLKSDERFKNTDISVMGHSWGGFSALNITALHPEISHVIVLSGFVSVEELVNSFFSGPLKGYRKTIMALEKEVNPSFIAYHATDSLKKTNAKVLLIYSENDTLCQRKHYDILKTALDGKDNVQFLLVKNKGHNPNYTEEAVKYLGEFGKARAKLTRKKNITKEEKEKFVSSYDWDKMTAQDETVWEKIFETLKCEKKIKRTYCISDIHGEYDLFIQLLKKINYSENDRLIICGDFIDKGKASVRLLKTIFDLPNAQYIMGNHEYMFFKFYRTRMHSAIMDYDAILWHLQQYFPEDGHLLDWDTVRKLVNLPYYIEDKEFICVHAGVPMDDFGKILPLDEALPEELVHNRRFKEPTILPKESKCVFFGHTPTTYINNEPKIITYLKPSAPENSKNISDYYKIHLDTGTSMTGVLGCFCVETCQSIYVTRETKKLI